MKKTFKAVSLNNLDTLACEIVRLKTADTILFEGEMGSGKTTLIKAICKALGVKQMVSSPSFSIVNQYGSDNGKIYHFDFYRLESQQEALDAGLYEYFYQNAICFVEWAEKAPTVIPQEHNILKISKQNELSRLIEFSF